MSIRWHDILEVQGIVSKYLVTMKLNQKYDYTKVYYQMEYEAKYVD